jgi:hypothetical protein
MSVAMRKLVAVFLRKSAMPPTASGIRSAKVLPTRLLALTTRKLVLTSSQSLKSRPSISPMLLLMREKS